MPFKWFFWLLNFKRCTDIIPEQEIIKRKFKEKIVSCFLEYIILGHYLKGENFGGYDVLQLIHEQFGFFISTGTVYTTLYAMERNGLLVGFDSAKKRVFNVTDKGKSSFEVIASDTNIESFITKIFKPQP